MLNYVCNFSNPPVLPQMKESLWLDGMCGSATCAYILRFWKDVQRLNGAGPVRVDGRIDPAPPGTMLSRVTHTVYTIIHLNAAFAKRYRGQFANFPNDPSVPALLGTSLTPFVSGVTD